MPAVALPNDEASAEPTRALSTTFPSALMAGGAAVAALGVALFVFDAGPRVLRAALPAYGIALVAIGLFVMRRRRFLPTFDVLERPSGEITPTPKTLRWSADDAVGYAVAMVVLGGFACLGAALSMPPAASILLLLTAIGPPMLALRLVFAERRSVHYLRLLARTPRYRAGDSGARALVLPSATGGLTRSYRAVRRGIIARRAVWHVREHNHAASFEIDGKTADGTPVRVHPGEAVFGSVTRTADVGHDEGGHPVATASESIESGGALLIVGRPVKADDGLRVDSTGPESLILFGAPEGPRRAVRALLFVHYASVVALLALGLVALVLAWQNPYFTRQTLSGEVTASTGVPAVHLGDPCVLELAHGDTAVGEPNAFGCRAQLSCGGVRLFGGPASGFFDCSVAGEAWQTPAGEAADPRIRFTPPNHVEARPAQGRAVQILIDR